MKWLVYILLLPLNLLAQDVYDNCTDIPLQTYTVEYDVDKNYNWELTAGTITASDINSITVQFPYGAGTYVVSVWTSKFGCYGDTSYHEVIVNECTATQLFFPNAFTPNLDGHNEVYEIKGRSADDIEHMLIYNRWGEIILEADGNIIWDGANCQLGVYTISIIVNNNRYTRSITLVK